MAEHCASCSVSQQLGSFVQSYGSKWLDGSILLIPSTGFQPLNDLRIVGTVRAVEGRLLRDGLVMRHDPVEVETGLSHGTFLACSFSLADPLTILGRGEEAARQFERLLALRNEVGLRSEEQDVPTGRLVGNSSYSFSHIALVNTPRNLFRTATSIGQDSARGGVGET